MTHTKILILFVIPLILCCSATDPVPFKIGKDGCDHCKMTLMSKQYGMELITDKGKVYKFDDISCAVTFYKKGTYSNARIYAAEHESGKLIAAETAWFLKSEKNRTPMNSTIVAFATEKQAVSFQKIKGGEVLSWSAVQALY